MAPTESRDGSSTSARRHSRSSPRSVRASRTSRSPGSGGSGSPASPGSPLTPSALRALAARHGIRPRKSLGQHFLIEPALARRITEIAEVRAGSHVLEVGAGIGSLTQALGRAGADVVAVEFDRRLIPALVEATGGFDRVRVVEADAVQADWAALLPEPGPWTMVANLPYNISVAVVMRVLEAEPRVQRMLVMVQREVGERLAAAPGSAAYGAVSLRVAYRADARVVRPVSRSVFWPQPNVDSVLVSFERRPPPVAVDEDLLWRTVEVAFGQRRKSMRSALGRLGLDPGQAAAVLEACEVEPLARPQQLGLEPFACLAERAQAVLAAGPAG